MATLDLFFSEENFQDNQPDLPNYASSFGKNFSIVRGHRREDFEKEVFEKKFLDKVEYSIG